VYFKGKIPKNIYPGITTDTPVAAVGNALICHEKMDPGLAYNVLKTLFAYKADLVAVHKEATHLTVEDAVDGSPIPFHSGAIKFFKEKGAKI
jgi:uncharacterized protein